MVFAVVPLPERQHGRHDEHQEGKAVRDEVLPWPVWIAFPQLPRLGLPDYAHGRRVEEAPDADENELHQKEGGKHHERAVLRGGLRQMGREEPQVAVTCLGFSQQRRGSDENGEDQGDAEEAARGVCTVQRHLEHGKRERQHARQHEQTEEQLSGVLHEGRASHADKQNGNGDHCDEAQTTDGDDDDRERVRDIHVIHLDPQATRPPLVRVVILGTPGTIGRSRIIIYRPPGTPLARPAADGLADLHLARLALLTARRVRPAARVPRDRSIWEIQFVGQLGAPGRDGDELDLARGARVLKVTENVLLRDAVPILVEGYRLVAKRAHERRVSDRHVQVLPVQR